MAEKIYIRNASGELEPVDEEPFVEEKALEDLIAKHPKLLAGEQMRPGDPLRWMLVKQQMEIAGQRVDLFLIDQDARPTLVEVKRGNNRELRRIIVGQMLDYAAIAASVWSESDMRRIFEENSDNPDDEISNLLDQGDEPDIDAFWERVETNLDANRLRLLFVADEIPAELERVVKFLNEQTRDNLEVLAVEVKQYPGKYGDVLVSRIVGQANRTSRMIGQANRGAVRWCLCSCGEENGPGRKFKSGHDARLRETLQNAEKGRSTEADRDRLHYVVQQCRDNSAINSDTLIYSTYNYEDIIRLAQHADAQAG